MGAQWITLPVEEYPKYQKSSYSVYDEENFPFAVSEYICTYYYDKQIVFFILIDNDKFIVYHNKGTGINGSELVEVVRF